MNLITFGDYTFPYNPQTLKTVHTRRLITRPSPFGEDAVEDYGVEPVTVGGEGDFFGADAETALAGLRTAFAAGGVHRLEAGGEALNARFAELTVTRDATTRAIRFAFRFVEAPGEEAAE